jgi:hypothetical protein
LVLFLDRNKALEVMKELIEHQFIHAANVSMQWNKDNCYSLILKGGNSLFLSAFTSDRNLSVHEDKVKGIVIISSHSL